MRGKLLSEVRYKQEDGITPADAGKTYKKQSAIQSIGDHPRGCGENFGL